MQSELEVQPNRRPTPLIRSTVMTGFGSVVPIPFLDDIIIRRIRKGIVHRILKEHTVEIAPSEMRTYYNGPPKGCLLRLLGLVVTIVKKIFKKLLRTVFFFLAIRNASLEMVETYLLGRTLDRCIKQGHLSNLASTEEAASRMRTAFETAIKGADRRIIAQSMRHTWTSVFGRRGLTRRLAGRLRKDAGANDADELQSEDLPEADQELINESASNVERAIEETEVKKFLKEFDRRFDAALAALPSTPEPAV